MLSVTIIMSTVNWEAVCKHLAENVMRWHIDRYFLALNRSLWADDNGNTEMPKNDWQPHKNWRHTGMVIDKMKERNLYLSLWYSRDEDKFIAYFYDSDTIADYARVIQDTELQAIALAAALATEYVKEEKTEAEILLDRLFKEGLYCMKDTKERILELFEQSFERACEEKKNSASILLKQIHKRLNNQRSTTPTEVAIWRSIEEWMER